MKVGNSCACRMLTTSHECKLPATACYTTGNVKKGGNCGSVSFASAPSHINQNFPHQQHSARENSSTLHQGFNPHRLEAQYQLKLMTTILAHFPASGQQKWWWSVQQIRVASFPPKEKNTNLFATDDPSTCKHMRPDVRALHCCSLAVKTFLSVSGRNRLGF